MSDKQHWQSFGELNNTQEFREAAANEFREDLTVESFDDKGLLDAKSPRRDFLKYLGFSTAAAALAASCKTPVRHVVPYLNKPADMVPGVADYYATTFVSGGDAVSILAKVRDGRPIKIEGNDLSSITKGGTSARVQASVLDLYDTARLRFPVRMVNGAPQEIPDYENADKLIAASMAGGGPVVILTATITSPTTKQAIAEFLAKNPGSRHIQYDADSYSGILLGNEISYGKRAIPSYRFDNAQVIVSLGADFLATWLSHIEYSRQYVKGRRIDEKAPSMNKHFQFESMLSVTGGNADERITHKPSETGAIALALLAAVGGTASASELPAKVKAGVAKAAKALMDYKGKALVVSGSNNPDVQVIVNAINEAVGANGSTIEMGSPLMTRQGIDSDFATLVNDMNDGKVGTLLVYDVNPAFTWHEADKVKAAIAKVKTTVSFNDRPDETSELCHFILPAPHFLESWGDAEPKPGMVSMMQPVISPLFKTRPFAESLMLWSGNKTTHDEFFKTYWTGKLGGLQGYEKALQDGVLEQETPTTKTSFRDSGAGVAASASAIGAAKKGGKYEIVMYQNVAVGTGGQANNPWLQELPDPITKASWDNYAIVSPATYKAIDGSIDFHDHNQTDKFEVHPERNVIKLKANGKQISIPVMVIPGTPNDVIAIAVGYGRQSNKPENTPAFIGRAVSGVGRNTFPFASFNGKTVELMNADASFETTNEVYPVAQIQVHNSYEGRTQVVREMTFAEFKKEPDKLLKEREEEAAKYGGLEGYDKEGTLYPYFDKPGIHWGMSIDMNSCFGCGACVVACHAENNVSMVGKSEVLRYHDMHWLRIDRYFSGNIDDADSIQTIFQPMMCQHCDNAPCENVCPVSATNHSSEGLNQMAYNRCIGTRYCANNCPFKVRRFNWADYTGADSFPDNQHFKGVGALDESVLMMNDDLSRMVLNPDVTVRSRGVMEKCSFCVQRLQDGKLKAKKENRTLADMKDVQTACQQACSTDAIVFGNINDSKSAVVRERAENAGRVFHVLEDLHVLPNVSYLAKVRNTEETV